MNTRALAPQQPTGIRSAPDSSPRIARTKTSRLEPDLAGTFGPPNATFINGSFFAPGSRAQGHDFGTVDVVNRTHSTKRHQEVPLRLPLDVEEGQMTADLQSLLADLGPGEPLLPSSRLPLEGLLGCDLGALRVYDNPRSHLTAGLLNSQGFTVGNTVVLGDPATYETKKDHLLAHEVAHAVQQLAGRGDSSDLEGKAENFANLANSIAIQHDQRSAALGIAPTGLARKVIWKSITDLGAFLLILDVDDGDFVGGCVRAIVPHVGVKLILKTPHTQLFNLHVGFLTNSSGEFCVFFYESVTGICEMKCFSSKDEVDWDEVREWLKEMLKRVFETLAIMALIIAVAWLAAEIAAAIIAALLILA